MKSYKDLYNMTKRAALQQPQLLWELYDQRYKLKEEPSPEEHQERSTRLINSLNSGNAWARKGDYLGRAAHTAGVIIDTPIRDVVDVIAQPEKHPNILDLKNPKTLTALLHKEILSRWYKLNGTRHPFNDPDYLSNNNQAIYSFLTRLGRFAVVAPNLHRIRTNAQPADKLVDMQNKLVAAGNRQYAATGNSWNHKGGSQPFKNTVLYQQPSNLRWGKFTYRNWNLRMRKQRIYDLMRKSYKNPRLILSRPAPF